MGLNVGFRVKHYPSYGLDQVGKEAEASSKRVDGYLEYMQSSFSTGVYASIDKKSEHFRDSEGFPVFYVEYEFDARIVNQAVDNVYYAIAKFIIDNFHFSNDSVIMEPYWSQ